MSPDWDGRTFTDDGALGLRKVTLFGKASLYFAGDQTTFDKRHICHTISSEINSNKVVRSGGNRCSSVRTLSYFQIPQVRPPRERRNKHWDQKGVCPCSPQLQRETKRNRANKRWHELPVLALQFLLSISATPQSGPAPTWRTAGEAGGEINPALLQLLYTARGRFTIYFDEV